MKKEKLISKLQALPDGIEVCIFDWKKSLHHDSGDGSSEGVHPEFEVELHELTPDEAEYYQEREGKPFKPFATLTFENDDYDDAGNQLI